MGLKRARARGELDRIEQESFDFFNRTRARYLELAGQDKTIRTIDATQSLKTLRVIFSRQLRSGYRSSRHEMVSMVAPTL